MWTASELLAISGARELSDESVVFAGVGAPLLACVLASRMHAPNLTIVLESGVVDPAIQLGNVPISTNEMRAAFGAVMLTGILDVFLLAQRGFCDIGFIGGAQIDMFGNVNTTVIGQFSQPVIRLPGSGGANDIASSCREVLILSKHERRRFVERVDFVTSPGFLAGGQARERAGLDAGCPTKVITDLAVMDFEPSSRRLRLVALQPGSTVEMVRSNTGFELVVAPEIESLSPPTKEELMTLRSVLGEPG